MRFSAEALAQVPHRYWHDLKQTVSSWLCHEGPRLAASLSLYSLLSLAPLVILSIALTSLVFGQSAAQLALVDEVRDLMRHIRSTSFPIRRAPPPPHRGPRLSGPACGN